MHLARAQTHCNTDMADVLYAYLYTMIVIQYIHLSSAGREHHFAIEGDVDG